MKTLCATALVLAALATPTQAQFKQDGPKDPYQQMLESQRREQQQNEADYDKTMKRLKAQNPKDAPRVDPWGTVRSVEPAKPKK